MKTVVLLLYMFQTLMSLSQVHPPKASNDVPAYSVCELSDWGKDNEGQVLQIKAIFNTDYIHSDHLSDAACNGFSISLDLSSGSDKSIDSFYVKFGKMSAKNKDIKIWINLVATYHWQPERVINNDLQEHKQLKINPHGILYAIRVLGFGEIKDVEARGSTRGSTGSWKRVEVEARGQVYERSIEPDSVRSTHD